MKGYRFITDDDTSKFCQRVTEALSSGWTLYGEPKMILIIRECYALWTSGNKKFSKKEIFKKN